MWTYEIRAISRDCCDPFYPVDRRVSGLSHSGSLNPSLASHRHYFAGSAFLHWLEDGLTF